MADETKEVMEIERPLVLCFDAGEGVTTHLYPRDSDNHEIYGILIADIVRHVAACFHVHEDDVWEWVEKERYHPTTKITQPS